MNRFKLAMATLVLVGGCTSAHPTTEADRERALAAGGRADGVDLCDTLGFYGDGLFCDCWCPEADPDCEDPELEVYGEELCEDAYDPCDGLSCGDGCTLCDPADPDCFETAVPKQCNAEGSCEASVPECSGLTPYDPCAGLSCGDYCTLCDPADTDCFETAVVKLCNADGLCVASVPECSGPTPIYDPCEDLSCGDGCTLCDPSDPDCIETAVPKQCNADGFCSPEVPMCEPSEVDCELLGAEECEAAAECELVWTPGFPGPIGICQEVGSDPEPDPPGPYNPCAGLSCGDYCTLCAPADTDCYETAVVKYCDADGLCGVSEPSCS